MKLFGTEATLKQWALVFLFAPVAIIGVPVGFIKEIFMTGVDHGARKFTNLCDWAKGDR